MIHHPLPNPLDERPLGTPLQAHPVLPAQRPQLRQRVPHLARRVRARRDVRVQRLREARVL